MLLVYMYVLKHSFRWDDFENYASSIIMQFDNDNNNIKCLQETERMVWKLPEQTKGPFRDQNSL